MKTGLLMLLLLTTPTFAQAPTVPPPPVAGKVTIDLLPNDEQALRTVCDLARGSSAINLETANQILSYCLSFLGRLKAAVPVPVPVEPRKPQQ